MCLGEISIGSGEICSLHSSIRSFTLAIMVRTTSQSSSRTLRALLFSLLLVLGFPATTVHGHLRCNPLLWQIFDRASCGTFWGMSFLSTSSVCDEGLAVISDHCSAAAALLRSRHKLGTGLRTFLTLVARHPLLLEYFGDKGRWRHHTSCKAFWLLCQPCCLRPLPSASSQRAAAKRQVVRIHSQQLPQCSKSSPWPL